MAYVGKTCRVCARDLLDGKCPNGCPPMHKELFEEAERLGIPYGNSRLDMIKREIDSKA